MAKRWSIRLENHEDYKYGYYCVAAVYYGGEFHGTYPNVYPEYVNGRRRLRKEDRESILKDAKQEEARLKQAPTGL
jgi:hypothetical protein